ncbi:hypothetical protein [Microvirga makkahensis]|uniref:hypothetical protein n=1 Tax=Microvirga makkahensis TaxID=1128670 RepID=UPI001FEBFD9C|nr:hypothetical protein [Microvirga makkahensis]
MTDVLFTDIDPGGRDGCELAHGALKALPTFRLFMPRDPREGLTVIAYQSERTSSDVQVPAEVEACRPSGLAALKERSRSLEPLTFDTESLAISKADTRAENMPIRMVVMGEA